MTKRPLRFVVGGSIPRLHLGVVAWLVLTLPAVSANAGTVELRAQAGVLWIDGNRIPPPFDFRVDYSVLGGDTIWSRVAINGVPIKQLSFMERDPGSRTVRSRCDSLLAAASAAAVGTRALSHSERTRIIAHAYATVSSCVDSVRVTSESTFLAFRRGALDPHEYQVANEAIAWPAKRSAGIIVRVRALRGHLDGGGGLLISSTLTIVPSLTVPQLLRDVEAAQSSQLATSKVILNPRDIRLLREPIPLAHRTVWPE